MGGPIHFINDLFLVFNDIIAEVYINMISTSNEEILSILMYHKALFDFIPFDRI